MPDTSVSAERETNLVTEELPKVAVSPDPLGTVIGDQFLTSFQSFKLPLELGFHVALPAKLLRAEIRSKSIAAATRKSPKRERSDMLGGAMGLSVCAFIVFLSWMLFSVWDEIDQTNSSSGSSN
jgi:hypothetical protein